MKRMYVTLALILISLIGAGTLLAQKISRPIDDKDDSAMMEKRLRMREEMHRRMMEKLLNGVGPDHGMFSDMESFLDEVMTDSFSGSQSFSRRMARNYRMDWAENKEGRTLVITPKGPEQNLNIDVKEGLITISGVSETKTPNGTSKSSFTNTFNVPGDCDEKKVKIDQKEGKIHVSFPYKELKQVGIPKPQNDRKPIPKSYGDVQI